MTNPAALQRLQKHPGDATLESVLKKPHLLKGNGSSSECRCDDRPGSFVKRTKIPWRCNLSRRSKRASAAKRKREEETDVKASLRLSSQSQRRQYVLSHETLGKRNYRLYCKSVYTYSLKSKWKLPKRLQDNKKAASLQARLRSRQSPHRKATRNAADAAATSIRRSQETTAEKTACNTAKAAATSIPRSQESMAEKTARH
ncbi:BPTF [Acanthosepion pharaonis]|uniref:BPTF n=1 Tax=Acanthosepion pharaonis TaxID=158019 RepID=A0A812EVI8_ACAPH|nr:BPTF [Sepia pharaonis]